MKSTGIVRKVDELGRIVIPREIRNKFEIVLKALYFLENAHFHQSLYVFLHNFSRKCHEKPVFLLCIFT